VPRIGGVPLPRGLTTVLVTPLIYAGVAPFGLHLLTVPGRRTGTRYTTPVTVLSHHGERWLVAPWGERSWVKNARAAGWVELRRGRHHERAAVEEVPPEERAPILRDYVRAIRANRDFFDAGPDDPVEAFAAEAGRHPVFRLSRSRP
jgi:deazaflavin-dependent oxidoreductase (nitroreductase family)